MHTHAHTCTHMHTHAHTHTGKTLQEERVKRLRIGQALQNEKEMSQQTYFLPKETYTHVKRYQRNHSAEIFD